MQPPGRFIADAVCPKCASVDRLKMDVETGLRRWCIVCDFDETLADAATVDAAPVQSDDVQVLSFSPLDTAKETK